MKVFNSHKELLEFLPKKIESLGLVPTMGCLHEGHLSLIQKATLQNEYVIVSIYVNPTQFDNPHDLKKYPREIEGDLKMLSTLNKGILVYVPESNDLYGNETIAKKYDFGLIGNQMEGVARKNHFNGVATVVEKLFELLKPNKAYFGEKDFQQILIIKKLVEKMNIKPEIISCPIIRNLEGLALSSRNRMLSSELKLLVPVIYKTLLQVKEDFGFMNSQEIIKSVYDNFQLIPMLTLDYFTIRDSEFLIPISKIQLTKNYRAFIAVKADKIRLIDNLKLSI